MTRLGAHAAWLLLAAAAATLEAACEDALQVELRQDWYDACEAYCAVAFADCFPVAYAGAPPDPQEPQRCLDRCEYHSTVGEHERKFGYDECFGLRAEYHSCVADAGVECVATPGVDLDEDGEDDPFWIESPECLEKRVAADRCLECVVGCKPNHCQPGCFEECQTTIGILSQCGGLESEMYPVELACRREGCAPSIAGDDPCDITPARLLSIGGCYGFSQGECEGFCFVAAEAGCGEGCLEDCSAKLADDVCGAAFLGLMNCQSGAESLDCEDGALILLTNQCEAQAAAYESCLAP